MVIVALGGVLSVVSWLVVVYEWRASRDAAERNEERKELGAYITGNGAACLALILSGLVVALLGVQLDDRDLVTHWLAAVIVWSGVAAFLVGVVCVFTIGLVNRPKFLVRPGLRKERGWLGRRFR
jgi:site-specific recombinase